MMKPTDLTITDITLLRFCRRMGNTVKAIALNYNLCQDTVTKYTADVEGKSRSGAQTTITIDFDYIRFLYDECKMSQRQIKKLTGISSGSLWRALNPERKYVRKKPAVPSLSD